MTTPPRPQAREVSLSQETGGLIEDPETHVHWLMPVLGGLLLMAVSLAGAWGFWLFVVSRAQ